MEERHDVVVIGGGPGGMAAALAAYEAGVRDVVILDREDSLGGILRQCIHSGFGVHALGKELTGPEYAAHFARRVRESAIRVFTRTMALSLTPDRVVTATSRDGIRRIRAGAVVLAMGCRERSRGALNLPGSRPAGIFTAGTAQKLMNCEGYKVGENAVILGSGDIGLIMARRLTLQGSHVQAVCEVMPYSGGLRRNIVQCLEDFGIPLYLSTTVVKIHGKDRISGVTVAEVDENRRPVPGTEREIPCDTLLLSCGLIPENELTRGAGIPLDGRTGGAEVDENRETRVPGIFACGNVLHVHDLVDYVSEEGEIAGKSAAAFVLGKTCPKGEIALCPGEGVRYVLPQRIAAGEDAVLSFRVTRPLGKTKLTAFVGETVLAQEKRVRTAPGEMERLRLPAAATAGVRGEITVKAEEIV